jgi:hypothetical protein
MGLQVEVKVLHAPVMDPSLTDYVQARAGEEVEVTCVVHAYPPPAVAWYRNGGLLAAQETVTAVRGERYTLIATPIGKSTCAVQYMCTLAVILIYHKYLSIIAKLCNSDNYNFILII